MRLTKHHGLGNDFLVLLDRTGEHAVDAPLARAVCDRHRGIGADGLLRASLPAPDPGAETPDAVMELYNADGSRAEMSGNGIRCLVQAMVLDEWVALKPGGPTDVVVLTDAGLRTVTVRRRLDATTHLLSVDMGPARLGGDAAGWVRAPFTRAAWVDMGNPHLVLAVDPAPPVSLGEIDLEGLGAEVNATVAGGANVHLLAAGPGDDALTIRTYERGAGLTQACGTGACASAAAARTWGLASERVEVHMPGGAVQVRLGPTVELTGPATVIAAVELPVDAVGAG